MPINSAGNGDSQDQRASIAVRLIAVGVPVLLLALVVWLIADRIGSRERPFQFSQESPEAVFESARRMVLEGRADLLTELVYADTPELRRLYRGIGGVLGSLQKAAMAANTAFPSDIQRLRDEAERAAREGRGGSLVDQVLTGRRAGPGGRNRQRGGAEQRFARSDDPFADVMGTLLSDPYGWLADNSGKLGTIFMSDNMVALTWDGRTIFPPLGIIMERREDDKWYLMLPLQALPFGRGFGANEDQIVMLEHLLASASNALADLANDISSGRVRSMDHAASKLGEYAFPTIMLGGIAYQQFMRSLRNQQRQEAPSGG